MAQASINHKVINLWTSRIIPLILMGIVAYVSWVQVVLISSLKLYSTHNADGLTEITVDYLLKPPASVHTPRRGTAVAILLLYFTLFLLMALAFFRLLFTVIHNPGYIPRGSQWYVQQERKAKEKQQGGKEYRTTQSPVSSEKTESDATIISGTSWAPDTTEPAPGLQDFYNRDAFICQGDGRPIWCSTCLNWKPDRAHHCREIERCVRKMDHFCPWCVLYCRKHSSLEGRLLLASLVTLTMIYFQLLQSLTAARVGGVVSETSFKFFIQFVAWTAIYCIFNLVVTAIFLAEYKKKVRKLSKAI